MPEKIIAPMVTARGTEAIARLGDAGTTLDVDGVAETSPASGAAR